MNAALAICAGVGWSPFSSPRTRPLSQLTELLLSIEPVYLCRGGVESLLFTSDTPSLTADWGNIDYELMTANFKWNSEKELQRLKVRDFSSGLGIRTSVF